MEIGLTKDRLQKLYGQIRKKAETFKYPLFILIIGIALVLLPVDHERETDMEETVYEYSQETDLESRMEELLCQIEGAGNVRVLLTLKNGVENQYQEDLERSERDGESEYQSKTVFVSKNGDDAPVVVKSVYPVYKGAVVVCEGADSATVRLNIIRAVASLTGLGSDKITVVKMKG